MRTGAECLACLAGQAEATAALCSDEPAVRERVAREVGKLLPRLDPLLPPPENAVVMYALIARITGVADPYRLLRSQSNRMGLELRERILARINGSRDPFRAAVHHAVAANIIDYGAGHDFDAIGVLDSCLQNSLHIDDTAEFKADLCRRPGQKVLYLADNSGELVLDALLIGHLQKMGCEVTLAVRGSPILNDATMADVEECGLAGVCRVITTGAGCPGIPGDGCSDEFRAVFAESDIIISKGQGNFETLTDVDRPIYYLLTVKCPAVAGQITRMRGSGPGRGIGIGSMVVMKK
jgi:hypothetical protein